MVGGYKYPQIYPTALMCIQRIWSMVGVWTPETPVGTALPVVNSTDTAQEISMAGGEI